MINRDNDTNNLTENETQSENYSIVQNINDNENGIVELEEINPNIT